MLDRIRRKLFLSLKVMGGDTASSDDNSSLGTSELMEILRKGSSALSRSGDDGLDLNQFLAASVEDILEASRKREGKKDIKLKRELGDASETKQEDIKEEELQDIEEEEKKLLSGIAVVQSRLFEGQIVKAAEKKRNSNKDIANEWQEVQKRARVDRIVTIDGIQVIADHVAPLTVSALLPTVPLPQ
jgi:SWI/SNF-related matrix-associated actin-dependent regulator of chromatin subfamily A member 5